jgi:DNA invertase Pin-like site-specific DNA recombinase
MDKVVLLVRVSTDKQEYQRQINELTDYCNKVDWEIVKVFSNKVSGVTKIEDREEIQSLIQYVKENKIDRVVCLEISRVGRNTLEALKIIQFLNENKVSLFIKNYNLETLNPDGTPNPITSLITTILLEIASMERLTIRERMVSGQKQYISKCKREGIKMGRPSGTYKDMDTYREQYSNEISLLKKGVPVRTISLLTSTSVNTIQKIKKLFITKEL